MLTFLIVGFASIFVAFVLLNTILRPPEGSGWPDIPLRHSPIPPKLKRGGVGPRTPGSSRPAPKPVPPPGAKKE